MHNRLSASSALSHGSRPLDRAESIPSAKVIPIGTVAAQPGVPPTPGGEPDQGRARLSSTLRLPTAGLTGDRRGRQEAAGPMGWGSSWLHTVPPPVPGATTLRFGEVAFTADKVEVCGAVLYGRPTTWDPACTWTHEAYRGAPPQAVGPHAEPPPLGRAKPALVNAPAQGTFPAEPSASSAPMSRVKARAAVAPAASDQTAWQGAQTGAAAWAEARAREQASLFRQNALKAKTAEPTVDSLPEVAGSHWALLVLVASLVSALLGFGYFGQVEVTSVAPGVLQVHGGPRPVLAQASGEVASLAVDAGDFVQAGQMLARIQATELRARERRSAEQLALLKTNADRLTSANEKAFKTASAALWRKRGILANRAEIKDGALQELERHAGDLDQAALQGVASRTEALAARQTSRATREELLLIRQQIADIDLELNDRAQRHRAEKEEWQQRIEEGEVSVAEALRLTELTAVRAPVSGQIESLLVTEGQVVSSGAVLSRIIPGGVVTTAVVFASANDAAFLRTDLDAKVEFASLPVSEFGKAHARVTRVSSDVASREEVVAVLGGAVEGPVIRIELELQPGPTLDQVKGRLRPGERLIARLNTRKRRIITLFFDFLRKWYPT